MNSSTGNMSLAKIVTIAVLAAAGLFGALNVWTGSNTFSGTHTSISHLEVVNGLINYSNVNAMNQLQSSNTKLAGLNTTNVWGPTGSNQFTNPTNITTVAVFNKGIRIGNNTGSETNPMLEIARSYSGTGNAHGYSDTSQYNAATNGLAYDSYDAVSSTVGTHNLDHVRGFQAKMTQSGSGTIGEVSGFGVFSITDNAGTTTNVKEFGGVDPTGSATMTNLYGVYMPSLTHGSTNWAWFSNLGKIHFGDVVDTQNTAFVIRNALSTFATKIVGGPVTANYTLNLPTLTENETVAVNPITNSTLPSNQTGTSSATVVQLGGFITVTPKVTGNIEVKVGGGAADSTLNDGCRIDVRFKTSSLGANGAAATGTVIGNNIKVISPTANAIIPWQFDYPVTGLTVGQKVYMDIGQAALTGGTCTITNVKWFVKEY